MRRACVQMLAATAFINQAFAQEGLRDVKAPVAYPSSLMLILSIVGSIFTAVLVVLFIRRRLRQSLAKRVVILKPWEKALRQLSELEKENILGRELYDVYYSKLSYILRRYAEEQFGIRAPEMTTEEFMQYLRKSAELD